MKKSSMALGLAVSLLISPLVTNSSSATEPETFWGVSATATTEYSGYEAVYATGAPDASDCADINGQAWTFGSPATNSELTVIYAQPVELGSILINFSYDMEDTLLIEVANGADGAFTTITTITADYTCANDANLSPNIPVSIPVSGNVVADRIRITVLTDNDYPEIDAIAFLSAPHVDVVTPVKTKNPVINGQAKVGKKLTANAFQSSWEGSPTIAYAWFACTAKGTTPTDVKPANCKAITSANKSTLSLKSAQKGKFIRVRVIATNEAGSVTAFSKSSTTKVA